MTLPLKSEGDIQEGHQRILKPLAPKCHVNLLSNQTSSKYHSLEEACPYVGNQNNGWQSVEPKYELLNYGKRVLCCAHDGQVFVLSLPITRKQTLTRSTRYPLEE